MRIPMSIPLKIIYFLTKQVMAGKFSLKTDSLFYLNNNFVVSDPVFNIFDTRYEKARFARNI